MIKQTITWREVPGEGDSGPRYEVYDSDTGTVIGTYDSREAAQEEVDAMNRSDVEGRGSSHRKQEADPAGG
ncbi:hypothetical protein KGQ90_13355 [Modicisalibacter tunisiensis]|uniref:hypothetical protein n=1 Tax=Modicisalibacter TaxID=574347 RepID=UPI0013D4F5A9|nr:MULTISPECIES: hypothetical protein [Modicisalibacter]MBZ9539917.1 hypothetical protein [Modicisalibacter tunisiensis]